MTHIIVTLGCNEEGQRSLLLQINFNLSFPADSFMLRVGLHVMWTLRRCCGLLLIGVYLCSPNCVLCRYLFVITKRKLLKLGNERKWSVLTTTKHRESFWRLSHHCEYEQKGTTIFYFHVGLYTTPRTWIRITSRNTANSWRSPGTVNWWWIRIHELFWKVLNLFIIELVELAH